MKIAIIINSAEEESRDFIANNDVGEYLIIDWYVSHDARTAYLINHCAPTSFPCVVDLDTCMMCHNPTTLEEGLWGAKGYGNLIDARKTVAILIDANTEKAKMAGVLWHPPSATEAPYNEDTAFPLVEDWLRNYERAGAYIAEVLAASGDPFGTTGFMIKGSDDTASGIKYLKSADDVASFKVALTTQYLYITNLGMILKTGGTYNEVTYTALIDQDLTALRAFVDPRV